MPKRVLDNNGNIKLMVYTRAELLALFRISEDQLVAWQKLIGLDQEEFSFDPTQLTLVGQRIAVLKTGMSGEDVREIEQAGLLRGHAELAQDAPAGISAHVWRSYAVIVMYQVRFGKALNAYELAEIAQIKDINPFTGEFEESPDLAKMHLRLLRGEKLLMLKDGAWEHQGLPQCLQKRTRAGKQDRN